MPDVRPLSYQIHEQTLANGLRVIASPDHAAPVVAVNLWYLVGSKDERPGATGFAHLFEHVMFQGSANVDSGEHLGALQAAGASVNATTWFDRTNYFESVPTGALDLALWLEADRMATLGEHLTRENLDTQREVVKEEKRQRYDNVPYGDMIERLTRLSFPADHPYGHSTIGSMADLDAASLADAKEFFATYYVPNNAVLTLVGDVKPADAFARARRYFGHIPAGPEPARPAREVLPPHEGLSTVQVTTPVPADAVYWSWRLPARDTRDFDALEMGLDVLGGGLTSRLYRRLVQGDESASAAGASALGLIQGNSLGLAYTRALEGHSLAAVEAALAEEVDRLCDEGPTDVELHRTQVQFQREWLEQLSRFGARADLLSSYAALHGDPGLINTRIVDMAAFTPEQVRDACRTYLRPEQRVVLRYLRGAFSEESA